MKQNDYFNRLQAEFKNNTYKDRFLQELEDHAEDLAENQNLTKKDLTNDFMQKHFGEPKQVKQAFIAITRPWQKVTELWEAIGIGLLGLFITVMGAMAAGYISGAIFSRFSDPSFLMPLRTLVSPLLSLLFPFLFYRWGWKYLKAKQEESLWSEKRKIAFVLAPIGLIFLMSLFQALLFKRGEFFFVMLIFYSLIPLFLARVGLSSHTVEIKKEQKAKRLGVKIISILAFVYFFTFMVLRILNFDFNTSSLSPVFYFISGFEFFILGVFPILLSDQILISAYTSMGLLTGLFLFALGWMILKKEWSWVSGAVIVYVLSTFFVSSSYGFDKLEFEVPSQAISTKIEKRQLGPFYGFFKENYDDLRDAFAYEIAFEGGKFIITQIERGPMARQFSFDPQEGWPEALFSSKKRVLFESDGYALPTAFDWPEELECKVSENRESPADKNRCTLVSFKGKELISSEQEAIFDPSYGIPFGGAVFSEDNNWLLLKISPLAGPSSVYLLDLRGVNANTSNT